MDTQPWFRAAAHFYDDPAVLETGMAWAWPFVLSALKASSRFGVVASRGLSDAVIYGRAQLPMPERRGYVVRDAYVAVGLLVPTEEPDAWTTPNWQRYQPDPTGGERVRAFRERNRIAAEAAARPAYVSDVDAPERLVTVTSAPERAVTPDETRQDKTTEHRYVNARAQVDAVVEASRRIVGEPCADGTAEVWLFNLGYTLERIEAGLALTRADNPDMALRYFWQKARHYMARWTPEETQPTARGATTPRGRNTTGRRGHHSAGLYDAHGMAKPTPEEAPEGGL